jgi:hypothetical protein
MIIELYVVHYKPHMNADLYEMFATSRNYEQLSHAWVEWRKVSGNKYRQEYLDLISIQNEGAQSLGIIYFNPWLQCSAVQCSAVQCSAVQCSAVQCSAAHYMHDQL